jgi:hypothetical protein
VVKSTTSSTISSVVHLVNALHSKLQFICANEEGDDVMIEREESRARQKPTYAEAYKQEIYEAGQAPDQFEAIRAVKQ